MPLTSFMCAVYMAQQSSALWPSPDKYCLAESGSSQISNRRETLNQAESGPRASNARPWNKVLGILRESRGGLDRQARGLPGHDAAGNFTDAEKSVFDVKRVFSGKSEVLVRVALRVNHGGRACRFVPNEVGSVRQARQIELLEDHRPPSSPLYSYFGWGTMRR